MAEAEAQVLPGDDTQGKAQFHAVLRFAVGTAVAFVLCEAMGWLPTFLAPLLAATLLGNLPIALSPKAGIALIMVQVKSPMLFAVGMYLPLATTFAIFVGGLAKWIIDTLAERRGFNEAQRARVENIGVLSASGMIAGEAMIGLFVATFRFFEWPIPEVYPSPSFALGAAVMALIIFVLIRTPLANPGHPDEPAPPQAIM